tara:strand:- start:1846 stop:2313 length:468 start_codon:yes stop_codon:yes gene_type:complete
MKFFFLTIIIFSLNITVSSNEISGYAIITDGDTVKILNNRIRLHGIDAPEKKQKCLRNYKEYNCGLTATKALAKKIGKNRIIKCKFQKKDRYNRYLGICFSGSINLNKWMVRNGHAIAYVKYSKDYIQDQNYAKKNKLGLWSGIFIYPEKWRKLN